MKTSTKVNNFNHGMIVPELVERSDLELFNSSCAKLLNMEPIPYGGIRTRRGTRIIQKLQFLESDVLITGAATSSVGDAGIIQTINSGFVSDGIGTERELFRVDYGRELDKGIFQIFGIKLDFEEPNILINWTATGAGMIPTGRISSVDILAPGRGMNDFTYREENPGKLQPGDREAVVDFSANAAGEIKAFDIADTGNRVQLPVPVPNRVPIVRTARSYPAKVQVSADNDEWFDAGSALMTESSQDFSFTIDREFRYIRLVLETSDEIRTSFSLNYISMKSRLVPNPDKVRLVEYVYKNSERYLIVLGPSTIIILYNGELDYIIIADVITDEILDGLKWTYKDDSIIFTHPDMPPQRLLRTTDGWNFGEYPLRNIPKHAWIRTETQRNEAITPDKTDGSVIITGTGFDISMVGQFIDGGGGYARITDFISATQLRAATMIGFFNTMAITSWKLVGGFEPVWSAARGWPRTCAYAQQRLVFGGSRDLPNRVWLSRTADYNNFLDIGRGGSDAISYELETNEAIVNISYQQRLHLFTSGDEWSVPEAALTPDTFRAVPMSEIGSWERTSPIVYDMGVIFVEKLGQSVYNFAYTNDGGGMKPSNISVFSRFVGRPVDFVLEKNSTSDKGDYLYMLMDNGKMFVQSINFVHNINALALYEFSGEVLSVAALADEVFMAVRHSDGIYIEQLAQDARHDSESEVQVNAGQIGNIARYEGKPVNVRADFAASDAKVENGMVFVPALADGPAVIGIPFEYEIESNPIHISGRSTSLVKQIAKATIVCRDTPELNFNGQAKTDFDNYEFRAAGRPETDCRYRIVGDSRKPAKILSVQLDISYGA